MYASRDRRRGKARILYWFRTPPHVRVGRAALDEEAIRAIEEHNPDVTFDWTRILKTRAQPPPPVQENGPDRRRHERAGRGARRRPDDGPAAQPPIAAGRAETEAAPAGPPAVEMPETASDKVATASSAQEWVEPYDGGPAEAERPSLPPGLHVEERLGPEGFSRLRARFAELMARITERIQDPVRLEELRLHAERLNPDTWITDEEAKAGIEGFDAAYEAIRARLGRRRRRSRRGGARRRRVREARAAAAAGTGAPAETPASQEADDEWNEAPDSGSATGDSDDEDA